MRARQLALLALMASTWLSTSRSVAQDVAPIDADPPVAPAEPEPEAEPVDDAEPVTETEPEAELVAQPVVPEPPAPPAPDEPDVRFSAEPGRGFTVDAGDVFSMSIRARIQLRNTLRVDGNVVDDLLEVKTARLWWSGHVIDPHVRFGLQLALGPGDFEPNNASPIFDAFLESTHLRDLGARVGQFFVPFDRARTIREFALQTVDRTDVVRELTLDRDVGIVLGSSDLLGLGGLLSYQLGIFGGDGRNRFGQAPDVGFLYVARVSVRPFGAFDDDNEGDLSRSPLPRLAIGGGAAFNQATDRPRSTTGVAYQRARFDYAHLAADVVFKWYGVSFLGEVVWRESTNGDVMSFTDDAGVTIDEWSRSGWGYLLQAGVMLHPMVELWSRWEHLLARAGTDPALIAQANDRGHGVSAGANVYLNGHLLKIQAEWSHSFGDRFEIGAHLVRLQLDASF